MYFYKNILQDNGSAILDKCQQITETMKRVLFFLLIASMSSIISAQDVIVKRNGDQIKARIVEITTDNIIKYKDFEAPDGPIRNIRTQEVFMVIYQNGKKETFSATATPVTPAQVTPAQATPTRPAQTQAAPTQAAPTQAPARAQQPITVVRVPETTEPPVRRYRANYFMIGNGVGVSYGGVGLRLQGRFGGKVGFGIHGGIGKDLSADGILGSAGFKFFMYKGLYIDTQFGLTGGYRSTGIYSYDSEKLYGPSLLFGLDQVWGRVVGVGFNIAVGATKNINADSKYDTEILPAFDLGFLIRF